MLPKTPHIPGFDFDCCYIPCADVSGDFYDFIRIDDNRLGICIGDVSGHGIEAAMVMGMAKKSLQLFARDGCSPKEVLARANRDLGQDLLDGTFVSAAYGILDIKKRIFNFARAGNNPPFLINPLRSDPVQMLKPPGLALGIDKLGVNFDKATQELSVQLKPGDLIFQYTDGLVEAQSPAVKTALKKNAAEEFGEDRLQEMLVQNINLPIPILLAVVENAIKKHAGVPLLEDDVTMIAFRVSR